MEVTTLDEPNELLPECRFPFDLESIPSRDYCPGISHQNVEIYTFQLLQLIIMPRWLNLTSDETHSSKTKAS